MKNSIKEKEKFINLYMKKLQLNRKEAEELYIFDFEGGENQIVDTYTQLAKKNLKNNYVASKVGIERKRKHIEDPSKISIISLCEIALKNMAATDIAIVPEKTIDFKVEGTPYTIKLTKHNSYVGIKESKATKRKVNAQKAAILAEVVKSLETNPAISDILVQTETKVNFNIAAINYTLALTAHRK